MNDETASDGALLAASSAGDERAFAILVRRHIRAATLLAAQLLGDRDSAEDVVQEAFTLIHRKSRSFDSDKPFGPWLFGIVRRLATNRKAREVRRERLMHLWGRGTAAQPDRADEEKRLGWRLDAESALRGLEELSPMQRACFELVAVRDLPAEEVAAMHGISASTVRQHVFRARAALRELLGEGSVSDPTSRQVKE